MSGPLPGGNLADEVLVDGREILDDESTICHTGVFFFFWYEATALRGRCTKTSVHRVSVDDPSMCRSMWSTRPRASGKAAGGERGDKERCGCSGAQSHLHWWAFLFNVMELRPP
jgi:hypothetical protein